MPDPRYFNSTDKPNDLSLERMAACLCDPMRPVYGAATRYRTRPTIPIEYADADLLGLHREMPS